MYICGDTTVCKFIIQYFLLILKFSKLHILEIQLKENALQALALHGLPLTSFKKISDIHKILNNRFMVGHITIHTYCMCKQSLYSFKQVTKLKVDN
jgi:hypothetical protein